MNLRVPALPKTSLRHTPILGVGDLVPANLDYVSMINGICKYDHPQYGISILEFYTCLEWLDSLYGSFIESEMWTKERAWDELDPTKACGPPYNSIYGPTKGHVMGKVTKEDLEQDFWGFTHVFGATLKDELRPAQKDARLFIPANICMVYIGNLLFGAQNESLTQTHNLHNIKIGIVCPGFEMVQMWQNFRNRDRLVQYDGSQWDSHIPSVFIQIVREFRKLHLPSIYHTHVDRYYDMIYNANVNVSGNLIEIVGQLSGQVNTTADNSFFNVLSLILHGIRKGMTLREFVDFEYVVVGDDGLYADSGFHEPVELGETWNSVGMYLETPGYQQFWDLTFVGTHPVLYSCPMTKNLLYGFRRNKLLSSIDYVTKDMDHSEQLEKLISILILLFTEKDFKEIKSKVVSYIHTLTLTKKQLSRLAVLGQMSVLCNLCSLEKSLTNKKKFFLLE